MDYGRMAQEYLEEVGRLNRRLDQLREEARLRRESDLWQREAEENGLQTELELQNAVQSPKQIRKTCRREVRRVCNALGWALAFFSVMTVLVSILLEVAGNCMGGRRRDQYVFEPDGKCSVV